MHCIAEIQVIPLGVGVSVRDPVRRAHELLTGSGLKCELHASGTNVEGELADVLAAVQRLHETLHGEGVPRLSVHVKLSTRTDKEDSMESKTAL